MPTPPAGKKATCETCRYFDYQGSLSGLCRIGPPTVILGCDDRAIWPVVENSDWCGEHEERLELPVTKPSYPIDDFPTPRDCTHDAP